VSALLAPLRRSLALGAALASSVTLGRSVRGDDRAPSPVPADPLVTTTWSAAAGHPESPRALSVDDDGLLLVSAEPGLFRFDGLRFEPVLLDGAGPLPSHGTVLRRARQGGVWIEWRGRGLVRLAATVHHRWATELDIRDVSEEADGRLWIATPGAIVHLDGERVRWLGPETPTSPGPPPPRDRHHPRPHEFRAFARDGHGALWVGGRTGLFRVSETSLEQVPGVFAITALAADRDRLWIGTSQGLFHARAERGALPVVERAGVDDAVGALLVDREGGLWIGTTTGELLRRDPGGWVRAQPLDTQPDGRPVRALAEDAEGTLWAASGHGLMRLRRRRFPVLGAAEGALEVRAVSVGPDGALWAGGREGLHVLRADHLERVSPAADRDVLALHAGARSLFILGTDGRLQEMRYGSAEQSPGAPVEVPLPGPIRAVLEDRTGRLLAIGMDGRLHYREPDGRVRTMAFDIRAHKGPAAFFQDREGTVWLATAKRILRAADHDPAVLAPWGTVDGELGLNGLFEDEDGALWAASEWAGLLRTGRDRHAHYRPQDGLPTANVLGGVDDGRGRLWLSTAAGIVSLEKRALAAFAAGEVGRLEPVVYGLAEGIVPPRLDHVSPTAARLRHGRLAFASGRGVVVVDPARLAPAPTPVITGVRVNGHPVAAGLPVSLGAEAHIELAYASSSLSTPERVQFRVRLASIEPRWRQVGTARSAMYGALPPGRHRFEVLASSADGVWGDRPAIHEFRVVPPLHRSPWLLGALALVAAAAVTLVVRLRASAARARHQLILEERGRLAGDVHDTLAQGLVAASAELDCVKEAVGDRERALAHVARARGVIEQTLAGARRSIWALRAPADDHQSLAAALQASATALSPKGRISVSVSARERKLPGRIEEALLRAGQEAMANALRHGHPSQVWVTLDQGRDVVRLVVRDDGRGFDPAEARAPDEPHQGLSGMRERIEAVGGTLRVESVPGAGTEVFVEVPTR
jgi:signal transduction histidine kinase/ligand-binding sensor domain-containing protein